jgi:hypothetical protein
MSNQRYSMSSRRQSESGSISDERKTSRLSISVSVPMSCLIYMIFYDGSFLLPDINVKLGVTMPHKTMYKMLRTSVVNKLWQPIVEACNYSWWSWLQIVQTTKRLQLKLFLCVGKRQSFWSKWECEKKSKVERDSWFVQGPFHYFIISVTGTVNLEVLEEFLMPVLEGNGSYDVQDWALSRFH